MLQRKISASSRYYRQPTASDTWLSFKDLRQGKMFRQEVQNQGCPEVAFAWRPPADLANNIWSHLNDTNAISRVTPHQNSLEAAFSVRQCDYYVRIRVSYFYHISCKSGFQWIHREVITSHLGKNPAWRLLDRKIEGWHETPRVLSQQQRCAGKELKCMR